MARANNSNREPEDVGFEAPDRLVRGLRGLGTRPVFVPRTVDEAILRIARHQFSQPARKKWLWPLLIPSLAFAVAILLFAGLWYHQAAPSSKEQFAREDINHDGKVDILDAFALARQLQAKASIPAQADLNGDGVVDDRDIELIAAQVVSLSRGGKS